MLIRKAKFGITEVLISKALIDAYINHDKFVLVNNVLREYNKMKEEIKNPENTVQYTIYKQLKNIVSIGRKMLLTRIEVLEELMKID